MLQILALTQATLVPVIAVRGARPDLLLLLALYVAVRKPIEGGGRWTAFWVGWAAGLFVDVYSAGSVLPLGSTALAFGVAGLVMNRLGTDLFLDSALAQVLVLGPVCAMTHLALAAGCAALARSPSGPLLRAAIGTAIYSALAAPLFFYAARPLERFLGVRSRRGFGSA